MSTIPLCITAGCGPAVCRLALAEVARTLTAAAEAEGIPRAAEIDPDSDKTSILVSLEGEAAEAFLRDWEGSVQVVARSRLRPSHRRKKWFVAVWRMEPMPAPPALDPADLVIETMRAGGPGGQHQNRTEAPSASRVG